MRALDVKNDPETRKTLALNVKLEYVPDARKAMSRFRMVDRLLTPFPPQFDMVEKQLASADEQAKKAGHLGNVLVFLTAIPITNLMTFTYTKLDVWGAPDDGDWKQELQERLEVKNSGKNK